MAFLAEMGIPNWNSPEEEDGILSGLKSINWRFRKQAIDSLASFSRTDEAREDGHNYTTHVLVLVESYTKNFNESNFNVAKAIMEILISVCDLHLSANRTMDVWICDSAVALAVGKISDKKLAAIASKLLTSLCEVQAPEVIVSLSIKVVNLIKAPLPHAGLLTWRKVFCDEFGAATLGKAVPNCVNWAIKVRCVDEFVSLFMLRILSLSVCVSFSPDLTHACKQNPFWYVGMWWNKFKCQKSSFGIRWCLAHSTGTCY